MRWAGTLGVVTIAADVLKAFGTDDDQTPNGESVAEPVDDATDEPYIPDEWYFATWRVPSLVGHTVECVQCAAQARYNCTWHNYAGTEVHTYRCSVCGQYTERIRIL